MSVAAASFLNNSWDISIRRTGFSFLMSGEVPSQIYSTQQYHQQQQQQQQQQEQEQQLLLQEVHGHRETSVVGLPGASLQAHSRAASSSGGGSLLSPSWTRPQQASNLSPSSFGQEPIPEQEDLRWHLQQPQQQDAGILQKFSALSVCISQSHAGTSNVGTAPVSCTKSEPVSPGNRSLPHQQAALTQAHGLLRSRSNNTAGSGSNNLGGSVSSSSAASTASGVFASLDSVDEHSPPNSPADKAMPALFSNARASSFPPYSGRSSASTNALCCCSAGIVCNTCKGLPFPKPIRASVSHPAPTRQLSQPTVRVSGIPHGGMPHHGDASATSPTGTSWFFYSHSLPAPHSMAQAAAAQGTNALSHLGWDILQQQASHHTLGMSSPQSQAMPYGYPSGPALGGSPTLLQFHDSGMERVDQAGPSTGAGLERDLANHWGFGLQSMDSSSLSLSQDCSDSLGGAEINSGASNEQEADSGPSVSEPVPGSASPPYSASLPPTSPTSARCISGTQSVGMGSPLVPRSSSSPMPTRGAPGGSPVSASLRRGLSSYFGGKSRSFTSLADVSSIHSIQELAKPVRNYAWRKRISSSSKDSSPRSGIEATRRQVLGVGKEPRGLFKKGGCSRQSLEVQAGLAVAVAMGDVDVSSSRDMLSGFSLGREEEEEGMETVMEETAEEDAEGDLQQQQ